jgi:hypothetical protein
LSNTGFAGEQHQRWADGAQMLFDIGPDLRTPDKRLTVSGYG